MLLRILFATNCLTRNGPYMLETNVLRSAFISNDRVIFNRRYKRGRDQIIVRFHYDSVERTRLFFGRVC